MILSRAVCGMWYDFAPATTTANTQYSGGIASAHAYRISRSRIPTVTAAVDFFVRVTSIIVIESFFFYSSQNLLLETRVNKIHTKISN